ncbi:MAG TPA: hypothetical protein VFB34_11440 [Chloroflexota bacterium]|nr:hypothetical protein [Chloroflexota bacterium]
MIDTTLDTLRFALKTAWVVPVIWLFGTGWSTSLGPLVPVYVLLGLGLVQIVSWPSISQILGRVRLNNNVLLAAGTGILALAVVLAAESLFGSGVKLWPSIGDCLLLLGVSGLTLNLALTMGSYSNILADLRFGVFALAFSLAMALLWVSHSQLHLDGRVYLGAVLYLLIGIFALAWARRFARDEWSSDRRGAGIDPDWLLGILAFVGMLGILTLALVQIFAIDIVGLLGNAIGPIWNDIGIRVKDAAVAIIDAMAWLLHLFGFRLPHFGPHSNPYSGKAPPHKRIPYKPQVAHPPPAFLVEAVKAAAIVVGGGVLLALLAAGFRSLGRLQRMSLRGERRVTGWSWRKLLQWSFSRGRAGLSGLLPHPGHELKRPRRLQTVRDVYRAYLVFGSDHFRPRARGETGLEYSAGLMAVTTAPTTPVDDLNALYMSERYRNVPTDSSKVAEAIRDLQAIEAAAREPDST